MKKSILGVCLTLAMVMGTVSFTFASYISLADVNRIVGVAGSERTGATDALLPEGYRTTRNNQSQNTARIINAQRLSSNEWMIRLAYTDGDYCEADFYVSEKPYKYDREKNQIVSMPFEDSKEGHAWATANLFGPCWYYVGVFNKQNPNIVDCLLFYQRINERRWPARADLNYSGTTGFNSEYHAVNGRYSQPCSDTFVEENWDK